jgi:hypothetical protein
MVTTKLVIEQMKAYDPEAATPPIEAVQPTVVEATKVSSNCQLAIHRRLQ